MFVRPLPSSRLLLNCSSPLRGGKEAEAGLFRYAESAAYSVLEKDAGAYKAAGVPLYDGVFAGGRTVTELCAKKYKDAPRNQRPYLLHCLFLSRLISGRPVYICSLGKNENGYFLNPPEKIAAELKGDTNGLEAAEKALKKSVSGGAHLRPSRRRKRQMNSLWLKISESVFQSALSDLKFIDRFNRSTFFKNVKPDEFSSPFLELHEDSALYAAELYAMTFYGLTAKELFTVGEVFSFSDGGSRAKDEIKGRAAEELSALLKRKNLKDLTAALARMGETLLEIPLPGLNVRDPTLLAKNYVMYNSCANIGGSVIEAAKPFPETAEALKEETGGKFAEIKARAELLSEYSKAAEFCDNIRSSEKTAVKKISKVSGFKEAEELEKRLKITDDG